VAQEYYTILTDAGLAYEAECKAQKKPLHLTWMAVGDGGGAAYNPTPDTTELRHETHRQQLNALQQDERNPSWYMAEALLPDDVGGWTIREVGIYTDTGILYAIGKYPESVKPLLPGGSTKQFYVKAIFQLSNAAEVTLIVDNNVVAATRDYVERMRLRILGELAPKVIKVKTSRTLTAEDMGLVLISAQDEWLEIGLPSSRGIGIADVLVQRTDNSGHRLNIWASSSDTIRFHTHLNTNGYPFFVLMGAGDWWHLRSDGKGSWWPIGRYDSTPLGRPVFETTIVFNPGGYGVLNGATFDRSDWPWLWDHAVKSGMKVPEASRVGNEAGWSDGDGKLTFRAPEGRGEFLRILDEGRGVDANRQAGSSQGCDVQSHAHIMELSLDRSSGALGNAVYGDEPIYGAAALVTKAAGGAETRSRNIAYPGRIKLI
jgi:phage-related tail fiber protein